jgi:hypothetical protein
VRYTAILKELGIDHALTVRLAGGTAEEVRLEATPIETSAIFVGEPTGSRPNFIGERIDFELPYSKVQANAADLFWQTSWPDDHRTWIAPDIYTPPTFEAYRRNEDPALEAILALREGSRIGSEPAARNPGSCAARGPC